LGRSPHRLPLRVERPSLEMRPRSVQHGGNNASLPALAVDHLGLPCDDGGQDFLLFALRYVEVVQCSGDLCSNLVELFGRDVEVFMRFVHVLAGVLKGSAGRLADPECPHEFKAWQLARLVPFLQGRVHIEFRILDDFVAEAVNDHADGVDAPDPFVKTLLCHWKSFLQIDIHLGSRQSLVQSLLVLTSLFLYHISSIKSMLYLTLLNSLVYLL